MCYQKSELVLGLEISKKKNEELQNLVNVHKDKCSSHELLNCDQLRTISVLNDEVNDLRNHIRVSGGRRFICQCNALQFCPASQLTVLQANCHCT
jgi:hypothetical protein